MSTVIELIKVLRERTGAGMMDCKKAIEENNGDIEKAVDWLREKGITKAAKKASRIAAEGLTDVRLDEASKSVIILEVNCETDFVGKGEPFAKLVHDVRDSLLKLQPGCIDCAREGVATLFTDATVKIGEKLELRRFEIVKADPAVVGTYIHMGGKISVLVVMAKPDAQLAKGLAMHIAANNPQYIAREDIPAAVREHETKIQLEAAKSDEKLAGKPEAALAKIIEGKVNKVFSESTLAEQAYLLDENGSTVQNVLARSGNKVLKFVRYAVGEGIEKRVDDFAKEVMSQVK